MSKENLNTASSQTDVICSTLPCPFCGENPSVEKYYAPCVIDIHCVNDECFERPSISEKVECVENKGESTTYKPMFEWHWQKALDKWNKRRIN